MARDLEPRPRRMTRADLEEGQREMHRRIAMRGERMGSADAETMAIARHLKIQLKGALETQRELWTRLMESGQVDDDWKNVLQTLREISSQLRYVAALADGIDITLHEGG